MIKIIRTIIKAIEKTIISIKDPLILKEALYRKLFFKLRYDFEGEA